MGGAMSELVSASRLQLKLVAVKCDTDLIQREMDDGQKTYRPGRGCAVDWEDLHWMLTRMGVVFDLEGLHRKRKE